MVFFFCVFVFFGKALKISDLVEFIYSDNLGKFLPADYIKKNFVFSVSVFVSAWLYLKKFWFGSTTRYVMPNDSFLTPEPSVFRMMWVCVWQLQETEMRSCCQYGLLMASERIKQAEFFLPDEQIQCKIDVWGPQVQLQPNTSARAQAKLFEGV